MAPTIVGQTTEQLAEQRIQQEQQARADQAQQATQQQQVYQAQQQPQQTQTAPYITHAQLKAARDQGASVQTGSPDQYGRATYAYVNGKLYNIALPEFAPTHAGTPSRGTETVGGIERVAMGSDRPGEFEQKVSAAGVSTEELKRAGYDTRELEQQQRVSELKQAIYRGEPGIRVSGEIKRQVETAKGIETLLKSPTAEFASQETAQRGFEKVLAWRPDFAPSEVRAGLKQAPVQYQSSALDEFRKAAGLSGYASPLTPGEQKAAEPQYYGLIQGMPLVKRQYDVSQYPTLKEYSILGFPVGRDIPVQAGKTYTRPSLFGRLQETGVETRRVTERDISTLNILGQGVALLSPVMPKVFAAARTRRAVTLTQLMERPKAAVEKPVEVLDLTLLSRATKEAYKPSLYEQAQRYRVESQKVLTDVQKQTIKSVEASTGKSYIDLRGVELMKALEGTKTSSVAKPIQMGERLTKSKPFETNLQAFKQMIAQETKQRTIQQATPKLEPVIIPFQTQKQTPVSITKQTPFSISAQISKQISTPIQVQSPVQTLKQLSKQVQVQKPSQVLQQISIQLQTPKQVLKRVTPHKPIKQKEPVREPVKEIPKPRPIGIDIPRPKYDFPVAPKQKPTIKSKRKRITTPFSTIGDIFNIRGAK